MARLGITAYPDLSPMERIREYFELASEYEVCRVVSSMLSVEGSKEKIIDYFREFIQCAHHFNMKVSLDVNTGFMKKRVSRTMIFRFFTICIVIRSVWTDRMVRKMIIS